MMAMASSSTAAAAAAATFVCSPSSLPRGTKSAINNLSSSLISRPKNQRFHLCTEFPQLGLSPFSPWSGLKHLGISLTPKSINLERKGRCKGMVVYASLFGVGAPEALVIGVVALLVFGPKGLAEVARTLGKTLRAFQPTIRELQEVSRDFKSTLEKEIGLDDISSSSIDAYNAKIKSTTSTSSTTATTGDSKTTTDPITATVEETAANTPSTSSTTATTGDSKPTSDLTTVEETAATTPSTSPTTATTGDSKTTSEPNGVPSPSKAYTSEEYLKITEEQLKAIAAQKQEQTSTPVESHLEPQTPSQATVEETAARTPSPEQPKSET